MKKKMIMGITMLLCIGLLFGCAAPAATALGAPALSAQDSAAAAKQSAEESAAVIDPSKKALLVVSFGTSYADTREKTIDATENAIAKAYPEYAVKRAFTSQTIIDILAERDEIEISNVTQAMENLVAEGYGDVVVQPLHVMNGEEYDSMIEEIQPYEESFASLQIGKPLLSSYEDYVAVAEVLAGEMPALTEKDALVFMGHGTAHFANSAYACMDYVFKDEGYLNVYVGTVEGFPTFDTIVKNLSETDAEKVYLMPLMVVAGDHAQNDMAGDDADSWKSMLKAKGYEVEPVLKGLGEMKGIQEIYIAHIADAMGGETKED